MPRLTTPVTHKTLFLSVAIYLLLATPVMATSTMVDEIKTVSVIADSSLALPLTEVIQEYTTDKHQAVAASFVFVYRQEKAVAEGIEYDVLITARTSLLDTLKQQGLVDIYTESPIAKNYMALVASKKSGFEASLDNGFPLAEIITSFRWQPGLIVGNPETLWQGSLAREILRYYGVIGDLEPYTVYEKDLSDIIAAIKKESLIGLVYQSDINQYPELRIVDMVPEEAHRPIIYVAVVLAGDRMEASRELVEYLKQGKAREIFRKYGMEKPEK